MPLPTGLSDHQSITAIETEYRGYRFRSRLEARWAVFFDALGLPWEYEVQGYQLPDGTAYLPDFWLPTLNTWYEVKPALTRETREAQHTTKAWRFMEAVNYGPDDHTHSVIAYGYIPDPTLGVIYREDTVDAWRTHGFEIWRNCDHPYGWVKCQHCGKLGITFDARNNYNCDHAIGKEWTPHHPDLLKAFRAARSARFEHGERPKRHRFQFGTLE